MFQVGFQVYFQMDFQDPFQVSHHSLTYVLGYFQDTFRLLGE